MIREMRWRAMMASAGRPAETRYLADSWRRKKRMRQMKKVMLWVGWE